MARLIYNNQSGLLGASLTSSGTTITFAAAPKFATLSSPDYIPLILSPATPNFEIVYLTAYTALATTGTITRAAEDSTNWPAVAHSDSWVCGPTVNDGATPILRAYRNAAYNLTATTATVFPYDTALIDNYHGLNTGTGVYTVPLAGYYAVAGSILATGTWSGNTGFGLVYKNGVETAECRVTYGGNGYCSVFCNDIVQCAVGDTLSFAYYTPSASIASGFSGYNWLSIARVGAL